MTGKDAPEHRAGSDSPAIVAAERDDVWRESMKARQRVVGHAHHPVPLRLKRDLADLGKGLFERTHAPGAMDRQAGSPQRANAAEQKPPGAIEAEGIHDQPSVPAALAAG